MCSHWGGSLSVGAGGQFIRRKWGLVSVGAPMIIERLGVYPPMVLNPAAAAGGVLSLGIPPHPGYSETSLRIRSFPTARAPWGVPGI